VLLEAFVGWGGLKTTMGEDLQEGESVGEITKEVSPETAAKRRLGGEATPLFFRVGFG